jgi:release factor glutamine methyltransferase
VTTIGTWFAANADLDRIDRELMLCAVPGITRARLLAAPETPLAPADRARLDDWSTQRRAGVPLAYIVGRRGFRDFELAVSPAVLVPRPETELLVETAIELLAADQRVLDLGTGSGAVAIALALETPARVSAVDLSPAALAVAAANAAALGATVEWIESDWFAAVAGRYHVIVGNPPYVAAGDPHLEALRHEPRLALVSGTDGLDSLRRIIAAAPDYLHPGGWLALEHGFDQGPAVRALFGQRGYTDVETRQDLAGHDRVSLARWP